MVDFLKDNFHHRCLRVFFVVSMPTLNHNIKHVDQKGPTGSFPSAVVYGSSKKLNLKNSGEKSLERVVKLSNFQGHISTLIGIRTLSHLHRRPMPCKRVDTYLTNLPDVFSVIFIGRFSVILYI